MEVFMSTCFFNNNANSTYSCTYEIVDGELSVSIEYDIHTEIESVNGVVSFGPNTSFEERDIYIVDYDKHCSYLLKNASYHGMTQVIGSLDGYNNTLFKTRFFFKHRDIDRLCKLQDNPKIKTLKIYSPDLIDYYGCPSFTQQKNDNQIVYNLDKKPTGISLEIGTNNIKKISIHDDWISRVSSPLRKVEIDFTAYIQLDFFKRVNYDAIGNYIYELATFMQLYAPSQFQIDKFICIIDDVSYELCVPCKVPEYKKNNTRPRTVKESIIEFLKNCYVSIPLRNDVQFRNIPYVVSSTSRSIEDNFLTFYRFIECYYKKTNIKNIKSSFISYSIEHNYYKKLSDDQIDDYSHEIISLRNHYIHSGYYIKNNSLRIKYDQINNKANPKNYTNNFVCIEWIYDRTMMLYKICIDIIYKDMLKYNDYHFTKHF